MKRGNTLDSQIVWRYGRSGVMATKKKRKRKTPPRKANGQFRKKK